MLNILSDVLDTLKSGEIEEAALRIQNALDTSALRAYTTRQTAVHDVNLALVRLKRAKQKFLSSYSGLAPIDRLAAENRLSPLVDALFDREILFLRQEKKRLSRAKG